MAYACLCLVAHIHSMGWRVAAKWPLRLSTLSTWHLHGEWETPQTFARLSSDTDCTCTSYPACLSPGRSVNNNVDAQTDAATPTIFTPSLAWARRMFSTGILFASSAAKHSPGETLAMTHLS